MQPEDPEQLLASGRLAEAAAVFERAGDLSRATDLYEKLWDHVGAMRCARAARDLPRALASALLARDHSSAEALLQELLAGPRSQQERSAHVCQERGAWSLGARLLVALGDLSAAGDFYRRAGLRLEAADCFEKAGQLNAAVQLYREFLESTGSETPGAATPEENPRFRLGRLLLRSRRAAEALPLLQQAWRQEGYGAVPAGRGVVTALARLGFLHGTRQALQLIYGESPAPSLEDFLAEDDSVAPEGVPEAALAGRYRLGKLLGSGGMGRVYEASDLVAERQVAVKVFTAPTGSRGRDAYRRFLKEAKTAGQLQHPHIVKLLDANEELGFMVLELMAGGTLNDRLRPWLDLSTARSVSLQVVAGLAAAHQRGIVHRDIKPSNIFFTESGSAKLGDFGVAHLQDSGQTQTGAFVGSVAFMAPEQITGDPITFATDVYALGVTLHLMLTGQLPFGPPDLISKHLHATPPRPSSLVPELPASVDEIVLRCMAKKPADRFESLQALALALEALSPEVDLRAPAPTGTIMPDRSRRAADNRYTPEGVVHDDGEMQVMAARDLELGRPVLLVRLAPGTRRQAALALLAAAASGGDEHLQRVFRLESDLGQAVLESPLATPAPADELEPDERLRFLEQLGLALSALHAAGQAHGAISASAVSRCGTTYILSLVPALLRRRAAEPIEDVREAARLAGLPVPPPVSDGATLRNWAAAELGRSRTAEGKSRYCELLAEALSCAPPGVDRRR